MPRPAVGHPAAPVVPRERDGRGARRDAGRDRRALRQPARAGERALRQPALRREAPRRLGADAPRTSARSPAPTWRRSGRPSTARTTPSWPSPATSTPPKLRAEHREGVRRLGARRRCRRARPGRSPSSTATRILLVDRPDSTQATLVLGHAGIRHADPALVRGDADELRAGRLGLLVAPDDRGARQARADLRHRLVVRGVAVRGRLPGRRRRPRTRRTWEALLASVERDPPHEDRGPDRRSSWTRPRATTPAATRSSCRPRPASRRRWSPPSCTAWASATCASCRCAWRPSTRRRPRRRRRELLHARHDAGRDRRQGATPSSRSWRQGDPVREDQLQGPDQRRRPRRRQEQRRRPKRLARAALAAAGSLRSAKASGPKNASA